MLNFWSTVYVWQFDSMSQSWPVAAQSMGLSLSPPPTHRDTDYMASIIMDCFSVWTITFCVEIFKVWSFLLSKFVKQCLKTAPASAGLCPVSKFVKIQPPKWKFLVSLLVMAGQNYSRNRAPSLTVCILHFGSIQLKVRIRCIGSK